MDPWLSTIFISCCEWNHCNIVCEAVCFSLIKCHCDFSELNERFWYGIEGRKRYDRIETRFIALFYVKNEVSAETIFIFIFYCATVSRENFIKLAVLFSDYFGIKNKTGWWFHDFKGHKIMKPPKSVGKKKWNWRHAAAPRPSVSFFFPIDFGGFIILCRLKSWNHQPVLFLMPK